MPIRFENLPQLLNSMRILNWTIDTFNFTFNNVDCIVLLTVIGKNFRLPSTKIIQKNKQYLQVKLEFISNEEQSSLKFIEAYADFFNVYFENPSDFYKFFKINANNPFPNTGNIFESFAQSLALHIPIEKIIHKNNIIERNIIGNRLEPDNPNAFYCFNVRRNGITKNGILGKRSDENSNKANLYRPTLYQRFHEDPHLSFCFSANPQEELEDWEIIRNFNVRGAQN